MRDILMETIDYIAMHDKDVKYIHYEDKHGDLIGSINPLDTGEDSVMVTVIAERSNNPEMHEWSVLMRNTQIMVNLKKVKKWKFYENYEEFFAEFFEAIL